MSQILSPSITQAPFPVSCNGCGRETKHLSRLCRSCRPSYISSSGWREWSKENERLNALSHDNPSRAVKRRRRTVNLISTETCFDPLTVVADPREGDADDDERLAAWITSLSQALPDWVRRRPNWVDALRHRDTPLVRHLVGLSSVGWTQAHEQGDGDSCPVCGGRDLAQLEVCLGCLRSGFDRQFEESRRRDLPPRGRDRSRFDRQSADSG
jgi:hypothetical protein